MRVLIEATQALKSIRGWGRYNRELLFKLVSRNPDTTFIVYYNRYRADDGELIKKISVPNVNLYPLSIPDEEYSRLDEERGRSFIDEELPEFDVYHSITEFPWFTRRPTVTTVHELTPILYPALRTRSSTETFLSGIKNAIQQSAAIICVSDNTERELRRYFTSLPPVFTIPLAAPDFFIRQRELSGRRRGILFVGPVLDPDKGFPVLLEAVEKSGLSVQVTAVSPSADLNDLPATENSNVRLRILSGISDGALRELYETSALLVVPSVDEGFGLPVVEALGCHCPVAVSDNSSLRGLVSDSRYRFRNADGLVPIIQRCLSRYPKKDVIQLRRRVIERHSWDKVSDRHLDVYRAVYCNNPMKNAMSPGHASM